MSNALHDGKIGFYNQGNSCFVNAICQCLLRLPEVQYFLLTNSGKETDSNGQKISVIKSLKNIIAEMYQTENSAISLESLFPTIDSLASYFCDGLQHDSHELLSFLLQGMEEETKLKVDKECRLVNRFYSNEVPLSVAKQRWWDEYLQHNNTEITKLFYGYSVSTSNCPNCLQSTYAFSSFNTMHITLPLTHYRIHVNLVYQYMNAETGQISLSVRCIRLKVPKDSTNQIILEYLRKRLTGTGCDVFPIIGHYDVINKQFSYSNFNPFSSVTTLQPTTKQQHLILAYVIPRSQLTAHHLLVHSTLLPQIESLEVNMRYMILPFLICFDTFNHEECLSRLNSILYNLICCNYEPGTVFSIEESLVPSFYLHNNLFFQHIPLSHTFANFLQALKVYESSQSIFPLTINRSTMLCNWNENRVHYSLVVDWNQQSNFFSNEQIQKAINSFDLYLIPVTCGLSMSDSFSLDQGLTLDVKASNASMNHSCDLCQHVADYQQTTDYIFPPLLIIQLKRFHFSSVKVLIRKDGKLKEETRYKMQKIMDRVDFPIHGLNLTSFTSTEGAIYDLYCVCNHYGTPDQGHYYSYCFDAKETKWFEYNDERVKPIELNEIVTSRAYLLFYRKRDTAMDPDVLRDLALNVPIKINENKSYTPSKWLNEDLNDHDEKETKRIRLISSLPEGHFHAYNAVPQVGTTRSSEFVSFIGGYKVTEKDVTKRAKMRDFRSLYSPSTKTYRGSGVLAEQRTLCSGEIKKQRFSRKRFSEKYNDYWLLLCILIIVVVLLLCIISFYY